MAAETGTVGADQITLTGLGKVEAGAGDDLVTGSSSGDIIDGGAGNDTLAGGAGNDFISSTRHWTQSSRSPARAATQ